MKSIFIPDRQRSGAYLSHMYVDINQIKLKKNYLKQFS